MTHTDRLERSPKPRAVRPQLLSVQIANALREDILLGRRRQGDPVTQQAIADDFGVSTMPVREALQALSHEGMITARTNHTFRVARMMPSDIEDMYWTNGALAGALAERACQRASPVLLTRLAEVNERLIDSLGRGDFDEMERQNWAFHREINLVADAPKILAVLRTVITRLPQHIYPLTAQAGRESVEQHVRMIEVLRKKDCVQARELWTVHAQVAGRLLVAYLTANRYWD